MRSELAKLRLIYGFSVTKEGYRKSVIFFLTKMVFISAGKAPTKKPRALLLYQNLILKTFYFMTKGRIFTPKAARANLSSLDLKRITLIQ